MPPNPGTETLTAEKRAKLIERCRRLRALATSSNPNEAASATSMLQSQLFKYNIELAELDAADNYARRTVYARHSFDVENTELYWQSILAVAICDCNSARIVNMGVREVGARSHKVATLQIFAEEHNVEIVNYLFDYLAFAISEMSEVGWIVYDATAKGTGTQTGQRKREWIADFRYNAARTINRRLREAHRADLASTTATTMALVVRNDKALDEAFYRAVGPLRKGRSTARNSYSDGARDGTAYGRTADINRSGISAGSSKKWGQLL